MDTDHEVSKRPALLLLAAYRKGQRDNISSRAAALAYYAVFSLVPIFVITVALGVGVFAKDLVEAGIVQYLDGHISAGAGELFQNALSNQSFVGHGMLGIIVAVLVLLYVAGRFFSELQNTLAAIFISPDARPENSRGYLATQALSVIFIFFLSVLFILISVGSVILHAIDFFPAYLSWILHGVTIFAVVSALFALAYHAIPARHVPWRKAWKGAMAASFLFMIANGIISLYFVAGSSPSVSDLPGSLAVVLVWIYYSSQVFLYGAELVSCMDDRIISRSFQEESAIVG